MDLTTLDLLLLHNDFEPSKIRLWEFVRRFNPLHVSAYLYMLENVTRTVKAEPIMPDLESLVQDNMLNRDIRLRPMPRPHLNLARGEYDGQSGYATSVGILSRYGEHVGGADSTVNTLEILALLKQQRQDTVPESDRLLRIALHNIGTKHYAMLRRYLEHLLFSDNLQEERENPQSTRSVVLNYLRYYKMFALRERQVIDPRKFRYFIVPRPSRVYDRPPTDNLCQSFYCGMHVVVNSSSAHEIRCFNRHGELMHMLTHRDKFNHSATFEAVLLPIDDRGRLRSWHYWDYRSGYRLIITDIYRFENQLLTDVPFVERLKYRDRLRGPYSQLAEIRSWADATAESRDDTLYSYVSGIMVRDRNAFPNEPPQAYKFPIRCAFDLYNQRLVDLTTANVNAQRDYAYHFMLETAENRTICLMYAHTDSEFYMCEYNDMIHQFEHACTLQRMPYDVKSPVYRGSENILVLNAKSRPMGVCYIRVYYDRHGDVYGYEAKLTVSKYDMPLVNRLFAIHAKRDRLSACRRGADSSRESRKFADSGRDANSKCRQTENR